MQDNNDYFREIIELAQIRINRVNAMREITDTLFNEGDGNYEYGQGFCDGVETICQDIQQMLIERGIKNGSIDSN